MANAVPLKALGVSISMADIYENIVFRRKNSGVFQHNSLIINKNVSSLMSSSLMISHRF